MKKVLVFGTFDKLHPGHVNMLQQAKILADKLVVVVARDSTVQQVKGHAPKQSEILRLEQVVATNLADKVLLGHKTDILKVVRDQKPDIIALGYDQKFFIKELGNYIEKSKIIRLKSYRPEIYKSSKMI